MMAKRWWIGYWGGALFCLLSLLQAPPGQAEERGEPMLWLESLSYQQMRALWEQRAEGGAGKPESRPSSGKPKESQKRPPRGQRLRRTYLRSGPFPPPAGRGGHPADSAEGATVWLEQPDGTIQGLKVKQRRSAFLAEYKAEMGGWYRLFAYNDLGVRDGTRTRLFSFFHFMSHGEKADVKEVTPIQRSGYVEGRPELELVRVYEPDEERYRNKVGQTIRVRALFRGEALAHAPLMLVTQQGWRREIRTDARGEGSFTLIKESFPAEGVKRRQNEKYLLRLDHRIPAKGEGDENAHYIATLPFSVYPADEEWQSKRLAWLLLVITGIGAAVAIAVRRRRRRPA